MSYVSYRYEGGKVLGKDLPHPRRCVEYAPKRHTTKLPTEKQIMAREKIAMAGKLRKENPELTAKEAYKMANDDSYGLDTLYGSAYLGGKVIGRDIPHPRRCVEYVPKRHMTKPPTEKQMMAREKIAMAGKLRKTHPELTAKEAYKMVEEKPMRKTRAKKTPKIDEESYGLESLYGSGLLKNLAYMGLPRLNKTKSIQRALAYRGNAYLGGCMECEGSCGMKI